MGYLARTQIASIASHQDALVTREQLRSVGLTDGAIDQRIRAGTLEVVHPSVFAIPGAPRTWMRSLRAAVFGAGEGSAISHLAAAVQWKLEDIEADRPHVLVPHERRVRLEGVVVHRSRVLPARDITRRQGLPLTTAARTLLDVAGLVHGALLARALDDALRRGIATIAQIDACLDDRGPNGVKGWTRLRRLVDERRGTKPTGSGKETTFFSGLKKRRLPLPIKQYEVRDSSGRLIARPDFAYPDIRLAIEVDGGHHATKTQWEEDLARQNKLILEHWRFLRFPKTDRRGQKAAFDLIERALATFGEPNPA